MNSANVEGDTALHVAARRQNVAALRELLQNRSLDLKIKNKKGETAADCAPSEKFGFDRDSSECAIAETELALTGGCRRVTGMCPAWHRRTVPRAPPQQRPREDHHPCNPTPSRTEALEPLARGSRIVFFFFFILIFLDPP